MLNANFDSPVPYYAPALPIPSDEVCEIVFHWYINVCFKKICHHDSVKLFSVFSFAEVCPTKFVTTILVAARLMKRRFRIFWNWVLISISFGELYKALNLLPHIRPAKHFIHCKCFQFNSNQPMYFAYMAAFCTLVIFICLKRRLYVSCAP